MAFYVGQKVVLVRDDWKSPHSGLTFPKKGVVYTVRAAGKPWPEFAANGPGILLQEIRNAPNSSYSLGEPAFKAWRFRPVVERKSDISIFTALLDPANHREHIDA